jgi:L-asparaginase
VGNVIAKIAVIATGGTVAMTAGPTGLVLSRSPGQLFDSLRGAVADIEVRFVDLLSKASANLSFEDLDHIVAAIAREVRAGASGVVVLQGTDTIEETAFALELMSGRSVPVCVTGAMRGAGHVGADGPANLAAAIRVAASAPSSAGVFVVMNDEVHAARYVVKAHTTALNAFTSGEFGLLGRVHEGRAVLTVDTLPPLGPVAFAPGSPWPRVGIIPVALGMSGDWVDGLASLACEGYVVDAFGAGHVPETMVRSLSALTARASVVLASRTRAGRLCEATYGYPGSESDLLARGLMTAGALPATKARILLALCLRAGRSELFPRLCGLI